MRLSQSALSTQIKTLEDRLGHKLFERKGRALHLTEVGQMVLDHADLIFETGEELLSTLEHTEKATKPLRVGALSTLSRNFQLHFLKPLIEEHNTSIILKSGSSEMLLEALQSLALDIVLTTQAPDSAVQSSFTAHHIADQPVGLHGAKERLSYSSLEDLLSNEPLIVPTGSSIRTGFDSLVARLGLIPNIVADVDDMAMLRLLAREHIGVAIAPAVVLADEIQSGLLHSAAFDLAITESFFAVTVQRNFPHPALGLLLS